MTTAPNEFAPHGKRCLLAAIRFIFTNLLLGQYGMHWSALDAAVRFACPIASCRSGGTLRLPASQKNSRSGV